MKMSNSIYYVDISGSMSSDMVDGALHYALVNKELVDSIVLFDSVNSFIKSCIAMAKQNGDKNILISDGFLVPEELALFDAVINLLPV
jgi:hypothetical protein